MELYSVTASEMSQLMTRRYSTSFSSASRFFAKDIRPGIYDIYGIVRLADEIVDTYRGDDSRILLDSLELETYAAMSRGFSVNPVVHAFQVTSLRYGITAELIRPFFESMRTDIDTSSHDQKSYKSYIYGSAEVVGLMCLRLFCDGNDDLYESLRPGAMKLGSAYQKVNFLRDVAADFDGLGRFYFPDMAFDALSETQKSDIITDIRSDFEAAKPYVRSLPENSKRAVAASYRYYLALLDKLERTPVTQLKQKRVRLSKAHKLYLLASIIVRGNV